MNDRKRSFHDELADIIIAFQEYNLKTRAASKAQINPHQFQGLLNVLVKGKLLIAKGKGFVITQKGRDYLFYYVQIQEMLQ